MAARARVVVVGDVMLDREVDGTVERLCPDAPAPVLDVTARLQGPGGAGLSALLCVEPGIEVTLVAPLADDDAGRAVREGLEAAGIELVSLGQEGSTRCKTRVRSGHQIIVRLDEGGPATPLGDLPAAARAAIEAADGVLVSCYGAGTGRHPGVRAALERQAPGAPVVWDPHPRGGPPVHGCHLVTPNLGEARAVTGLSAAPPDLLATTVRREWRSMAAAVTAGSSGAWLDTGDDAPVHVPAGAVADGDACGAGDRFAAAAVTALARGAEAGGAVAHAVARATEWVAAGGAWALRQHGRTSLTAAPGPSHHCGDSALPPDGGLRRALERIARVRTRGGTVVATGGCFDLLHAGHLLSLEAARGLGDALVVLLNSDASVRRLKGPGRPVQTMADRARLLEGLTCVDAVVVFDEDDPRHLLADLRPDVWAKGGDYAGVRLPEAELVRGWGGRVVLLPHLAGRSTTALLKDVG